MLQNSVDAFIPKQVYSGMRSSHFAFTLMYGYLTVGFNSNVCVQAALGSSRALFPSEFVPAGACP